MAKRIILECDLCGKPIKERPDPGTYALRRLMGDPRIEMVCSDCVERAEKILLELFSESEELTFRAFFREVFGRGAPLRSTSPSA